jgi:hypothetical protein
MPWKDKPQAFVEVQKIEQEEHQPDGVAATLSEAAWIMLKEAMPAPNDATAAAIMSSRGRCRSVDARPDRGVHACGSRQFLISYSHSGPSGACCTSWVSCW